METNYSKNIICPNCGFEDVDSWEQNDYLSNGSFTKIQCQSCGDDFLAQMDVKVSYSTKNIDNENKETITN